MNWIEPAEVKAIRARLGMSQRELAIVCGVHERTVRMWEIKTGARGATATLLNTLDETKRAGLIE